MAERRPFGTNKYAVAMAASLLVIIGGMMTTVVLAVAAGAEPIPAVISAVATFCLISLIPLRMMRPGRSPQFPRGRRESVFTVLARLFESRDHDKTPLRPWKRKQSDFVPQPHGSD